MGHFEVVLVVAFSEDLLAAELKQVDIAVAADYDQVLLDEAAHIATVAEELSFPPEQNVESEVLDGAVSAADLSILMNSSERRVRFSVD